jgi:histidinol-phosphate aminotransferase
MYGLAALRIGYAIASVSIIKKLNGYKVPYNCNSIGSSAACAALLDKNHIQQSIMTMQQGRVQLETGFEKLMIEYITSVTNFITVNIARDAIKVAQDLLHQGVMVRPLTPYGLPSHLRITIGTYEQNIRLLAALSRVLD